MNIFLVSCTAGASFLLAFLLFFHPLKQNIRANRWLGFFVLLMGIAFVGTYLLITGKSASNLFLFKLLSCLQFLLAPSLFISISYFVHPTKEPTKKDFLHFLPFFLYSITEFSWASDATFSSFELFAINDNISFLVRDLLPLIMLVYLLLSYLLLVKHRAKLRLITSNLHSVQLDWLMQFLVILLFTVFVWLNDALLELPFVTDATVYVYAVSIFFLAYFSIRQKAIFPFNEKDIKEITDVIESNQVEPMEVNPSTDEPTKEPVANGQVDAADVAPEVKIVPPEKPKAKRLHTEQVETLSAKLVVLMKEEKLFLDNDLDLPTVAEKLGLGIHDTSFLINETTGSNFYNFINGYRVEEAKRLLSSPKIEELNIPGIAFASGFNSKTTFNTTFKKMVGVSPSQYSKQQKNES